MVYRWEGGGFAPVEVTVSRNSISRVVVDKGLQAGDRIALRDPTARRRRSPAGSGGAAARRRRRVRDRGARGAGLQPAEPAHATPCARALSVLGIIFGVGAVIAMLSIGAGAEKEALEIIDAMGLRNVIVRDKVFDRDDEKQEIRRKSAGLALRDAEAIRDAVPGVERVIAKIEVDPWKTLTATGRAKPKVVGVSHDYPRAGARCPCARAASSTSATRRPTPRSA